MLEFQAGARELGHNAKVGYFSQHRVDMLEPGAHGARGGVLDTPQRVTEQTARTVLGSFLFRGDDVFSRRSAC